MREIKRGVLLVDDHALLRHSVAKCINAEADFEVVGEAGDAESAVTIALKIKPAIILMDIDMPGAAPFDAARDIHAQLPDTRVVFLSAYSHDRYIEAAIEAKASGYISKGESAETVLQALRAVADGRIYFSPDVRSRITIDINGAKLTDREGNPVSKRSLLTIRETEVLRHIAQGLTKKQIATLMHLSVKTIDNHTTNLMGKLDIHDRVELTRYAIREGISQA
jgi:DNA-binding NarL/FixJ family response regulator